MSLLKWFQLLSLWKTSCGVTIQNSLKDIKGKVKAHTSQMPKLPELAYPGFISTKHLGELLLSPGRDASPFQGYPKKYVAGTHLYTLVKRDKLEYSSLSKETMQWARPEPRTSRSRV